MRENVSASILLVTGTDAALEIAHDRLYVVAGINGGGRTQGKPLKRTTDPREVTGNFMCVSFYVFTYSQILKMEPVHLILFLLAILVQGIMAMYPCNQTAITGNGTVFPGEIPPTMKNCTFTFSINAIKDTLMLIFSSLGSLCSGDNIVIIAGSEVNTSIISRNGVHNSKSIRRTSI